MESTIEKTFAAGDFKNEQTARWCPGCGDHAILNVLNKAMAEVGVEPRNTVVVSGIGCSSRLPYYMNTYGMHTIHGRAAAIATGLKVARPDLMVWQVSGDGDGLAIGGNHFIHALRRNIDINILLFNNRIYGLTKGQYSPTSERGTISKSSPYGTTEDPFIPAELCFGARGNFFARSFDIALDTTKEVMVAAARHKGASVVEVLQNCVIFNNGIYDFMSSKENRDEHTIHLVDGEKMLFGKNKEKGLVQDGFGLKAVTVGEDGYTIDDVLIHHSHTDSYVLHEQLAMMDGHTLPMAIGVIRDVDSISYETAVANQVEEVRAKKAFKNLRDMVLRTSETWEVK